jgi:hypothetical protein
VIYDKDKAKAIYNELTPEQRTAAVSTYVYTIGNGDPVGARKVINVLSASMHDFMLRKIEHHAGETEEEIFAAPQGVAEALAHEIDHVALIAAAYDELKQALDAWVDCLANNIHEQAKNN